MAMDPRSQAALRQQIDQKIDQFSADLKEDILRAIDISERAPEMALIQIRKLLEKMLRKVYVRRLGMKAGTQPLENIAQRLVKEQILPQRVASYVSVIRELGNTGAHAERVPGQRATEVTPQDCWHALQALEPVFDWYADEEGPAVVDTDTSPDPELDASRRDAASVLNDQPANSTPAFTPPPLNETKDASSVSAPAEHAEKNLQSLNSNIKIQKGRKGVSWGGNDIASVVGAFAGLAVGYWAYNYFSPIWGIACGVGTWIILSVILMLGLT
jgi:hypothetical protein